MGFIKFVFVLVIVIPLAVLMMYFINNLNEKLKTSSKDPQNERKSEKKNSERRGSSIAGSGESRRNENKQYVREQYKNRRCV